MQLPRQARGQNRTRSVLVGLAGFSQFTHVHLMYIENVGAGFQSGALCESEEDFLVTNIFREKFWCYVMGRNAWIEETLVPGLDRY